MLIVFCLVTHSRIVSLCRSPLWLQSVPLHLNESSFGLEVGAADEGEICRVNLCAEQITVTATRAHGSSSNTRIAQHCCWEFAAPFAGWSFECPIYGCQLEQEYHLISLKATSAGPWNTAFKKVHHAVGFIVVAVDCCFFNPCRLICVPMYLWKRCTLWLWRDLAPCVKDKFVCSV